ncbi:unnamed protein product [Closterium sp. NIES-54]
MMLLLTLATFRTNTPSASPTATSPTAATAVTATAASTAATRTPTPSTSPTAAITPPAAPTTSPTATSSTTAAISTTPATLALAGATLCTSISSPNVLGNRDISSSSRGVGGGKGGGGAPLKEGRARNAMSSTYSNCTSLSGKEMLLEEVNSEGGGVKREKVVPDTAKRVMEASDYEVDGDEHRGLVPFKELSEGGSAVASVASAKLPEGPKAITSNWLFKIKSDADGKIERYKCRLVEKGYQQKEKVDYKELFAPVVKPTTLRTLLAGAAIKGWVVKQMDVTTAFLNGVLEEEIFMAQPAGFDDGSGRVWKLKKDLYGLKQAPRQCYLKLRGVLEEIGFTPSTADHSLFMLSEGEQRSFMVVYVDDILIFSPSSDFVKEVMLKLQDKFKCRALGDVNFYLGLLIERDVEKRCMRVHQRKYLEALAANFGKSEGHVATPFPSGFKCVKGPEEESIGEEERRRFHLLVGSLMYAAVNTRPDVAFATGQLARVVQCPNEE